MWSSQIGSYKICLSWPYRIIAQQIAKGRIDSHHLVLKPKMIEQFHDQLRFVSRTVRKRSHDSGNLAQGIPYHLFQCKSFLHDIPLCSIYWIAIKTKSTSVYWIAHLLRRSQRTWFKYLRKGKSIEINCNCYDQDQSK